ncbi:EB domain containing protein [Aphelenchoides avenae]|nr:EB domain containing protein [Aphelenchus avenae]
MECREGICECPKGFLLVGNVCKRVQCSVGFKGEPSVDSQGRILRCRKSSDCSQGSMCDPYAKVCCKGTNRCPRGFVETGELCVGDNVCKDASEICIVPKKAKHKMCCRAEEP